MKMPSLQHLTTWKRNSVLATTYPLDKNGDNNSNLIYGVILGAMNLPSRHQTDASTMHNIILIMMTLDFYMICR